MGYGRDADGAELMDLSGTVWRGPEDDDDDAAAGAEHVPSFSTSFILVSLFSTTTQRRINIFLFYQGDN